MKLRQVGTDPNHPCKIKTRPMRVLWQQPAVLCAHCWCTMLPLQAVLGLGVWKDSLVTCALAGWTRVAPVVESWNAGFEWELWVGSSAAVLASDSNGLPRFIFKVTEKCLDLFKPSRGSGVWSNVTLQLLARLHWLLFLPWCLPVFDAPFPCPACSSVKQIPQENSPWSSSVGTCRCCTYFSNLLVLTIPGQ